MKLSKVILTLSAALFTSTAVAAQEPVHTYDAYFNPATSSAQCNTIFLGHLSDQIIQFEQDGRVKVQVALFDDHAGNLYKSSILVNHKAFVPYFSTDKTPVPYEDGPRLVRNHTLESYMPGLRTSNGWFLHGYGIPYVRSKAEVIVSDEVLAVDYLYETAHKSKPSPSEIRAIRAVQLLVDLEKVVLNVTQLYDDNDPVVPKFFKNRAPWTRDTLCTMTRM